MKPLNETLSRLLDTERILTFRRWQDGRLIYTQIESEGKRIITRATDVELAKLALCDVVALDLEAMIRCAESPNIVQQGPTP